MSYSLHGTEEEQLVLITSVFLWLVEGIGAQVMTKLMYTVDKDIERYRHIYQRVHVRENKNENKKNKINLHICGDESCISLII
jgi:hypothetical protein